MIYSFIYTELTSNRDPLFKTVPTNNNTILLLLSHSLMSDSFQPHELYVACQAPLSMGFPRQE